MAEQNDEWAIGKRYFSQQFMDKQLTAATDQDMPVLAPPPLSRNPQALSTVTGVVGAPAMVGPIRALKGHDPVGSVKAPPCGLCDALLPVEPEG